MLETINLLVGIAIAALHLGLLGLAALYFADRSQFDRLVDRVRPYALPAGAILGAGAIVMSLFYSDVVGYPVCFLCWWQRIAIYPIALLFGIAWWKKDFQVARYIVPLAAFGLMVAVYHQWVQTGGHAFVPCPADPGAVDCAKIFFQELGYVTFPIIAGTVLAYDFLLALVAKPKEGGIGVSILRFWHR